MTSTTVDRRPAAPTRSPAKLNRSRWLEVAVLAAILLLAALTRLPGLDVRGQWDSDQGHDMRVLAAFVQHGQWPLLGPMTSVGAFHHGAFYYYLLAPAALVSGADPVAVMAEFALLGIAGVAATWWLARLVGGPVAAAVAALLLAASPAAISESTFIWNPNPIPLFAALAYAGVVRARATGAVRWWLLAAFGAMATMQLHWLGGVLALPVGLAWVLAWREARRAGRSTTAIARAGLAGLGVLALGYVPLAIHELTSGGTELRAIAAYAAGGGEPGGASLVVRLIMVPLRVLTWPIAGLITDRVGASLATLVIVVALAIAGVVLAGRRAKVAEGAGGGVEARRGSAEGAGADEGDGAGSAEGAGDGHAAGRAEGGSAAGANTRAWAARWLLASIALSALALVFAAPSLATIVPGLPNDHYHAFLDPVIVTLVGLGVAELIRLARAAVPARVVGPAAGVGLAAVLLGIAFTAWPPAVSPDGGWRLVDLAAARVIDVSDAGWPPTEPRVLASVPIFKPDDALRFPLEHRGYPLEPAEAADMTTVGVLTVVCDPLFDDATGFACGGPAEDRYLADTYPPGTMQLVERFRAGPRRIISIYGPSRLALEAP